MGNLGLELDWRWCFWGISFFHKFLFCRDCILDISLGFLNLWLFNLLFLWSIHWNFIVFILNFYLTFFSLIIIIFLICLFVLFLISFAVLCQFFYPCLELLIRKQSGEIYFLLVLLIFTICQWIPIRTIWYWIRFLGRICRLRGLYQKFILLIIICLTSFWCFGSKSLSQFIILIWRYIFILFLLWNYICLNIFLLFVPLFLIFIQYHIFPLFLFFFIILLDISNSICLFLGNFWNFFLFYLFSLWFFFNIFVFLLLILIHFLILLDCELPWIYELICLPFIFIFNYFLYLF